MSPRPLTIALLALSLSACQKDGDKSNPPDVTGGDVADATDGDSSGPTEPEKPKGNYPDVPQEPDPAGLSDAAGRFLVGNYKGVKELVEPMYADLKARNQYRASGLAAGWLALFYVHSDSLYEQAEEPAKWAVEMALHTQDAEVRAVAKMGYGSVLMGQEDFPGAAAAFEDAASSGKGTALQALAEVLLGEARIGSAFGHSNSNKVEKPEELDKANAAYDSAAAVAEQVPDKKDIILGRVEEGRAAVARYRRKKDELCVHAFAAIGHYEAANAAGYLKQGPQQLAEEFRCKPPKK